MAPWLFSMFMVGAMREVKERTGDIGVSLWNKRRNSGRMHSNRSADTVLVGNSEDKLQSLLKKIWRWMQEEEID